MGTAGAADTTIATLVGTMGMLDGSTAQSQTATSPGLGKPSSLEPGQVGGGSNVGILPVVGSMDSIGSGGCSKCEGELRLHVWRKKASVRTSRGTYTQRYISMKTWRCHLCSWVKLVCLDHPLQLLRGEGHLGVAATWFWELWVSPATWEKYEGGRDWLPVHSNFKA